MRFILTTLLLFCYSIGFSCYNEYHALDAQGHFHQMEVGEIRFQTNFDMRRIEKQLLKLGQKLQTKADFKLLSDYGLYLVKAGKVKEALVLFEALAKAYPNEYSIIANLGTTYELSGNNEKALEYIRKGLKLNPNSHAGSEWIHVKLLLAKIELAKNPDYLTKNTILNLTPQQEASETIRKQLYIQLQERFPFCKGPDPIMADLFIDLGDCYVSTISFEHAKGLYQIAKLYYKTERTDVDEKIEQVRKLRAKYANLQPDETTTAAREHGMVSKISGIPYTSFLRDPNSDHYSVNWSKIETDPGKLLALIGLSPVEDETPKAKESKPEPESKPKDKTVKPVKKTNPSTLWISLGMVAFIIAIFTYFRTKRK
ncbi:Tetratricopeptide repeat protein [compost metagenome]